MTREGYAGRALPSTRYVIPHHVAMPGRRLPTLRFTLGDGRSVLLRPIVPEDRQRLAEGFEHLSETSRYYRFISALSRLSEAQLDYLTDVDGVDHVAWGALADESEAAEGLGVGRFLRLPEAPHVAEFSLTVLDAVQGQGLGSLLLAVLYAVAPTLDVGVLRGVVARDNERMAGWLRRLGAELVERGSELVFDLPVTSDLCSLPDSPSADTFRALVEQVRAQLDPGRAQVQKDA